MIMQNRYGEDEESRYLPHDSSHHGTSTEYSDILLLSSLDSVLVMSTPLTSSLFAG